MLLIILLSSNSVNPTFMHCINNLCVFINAFLLSSSNNRVKIINSRRILYDSQTDLKFPLEYFQNNENIEIFDSSIENDLGYSLIDIPESILIYDLTVNNGNSGSYLRFLKSMFVAQSHKIKIHAFSYSKNSFIKMCCNGTDGIFLKEASLVELFMLLGNIPIQKDSYEILCCCNKTVRIGLICPICLSVFCKFKPVCSKCKTKFNFIK